MSPCVIFSETWFWYTGPRNFGLARRQSLFPVRMDSSHTFGPKWGKHLETRKWSQLFNDYHVWFQPLINRPGEKGRKSKNIPRWIWIFLHFFFLLLMISLFCFCQVLESVAGSRTTAVVTWTPSPPSSTPLFPSTSWFSSPSLVSAWQVGTQLMYVSIDGFRQVWYQVIGL